ncbi:hypothetical protein BHAOGJBA_1389 [Methylobacterium hispanicum]|uniref:Transposase IS200-like domain-containing protein n=1 Tax=Methylobacterium hispanicum TaxID=270350 RepID=A0AAV4ZI72_9HYPH|nr:IS200/IS605 family transposase [Methylobacterium hispanicum]GJD87883.1 hypothetical protein BHAOGJBA_1389 [Methylobacterium hispanicum]
MSRCRRNAGATSSLKYHLVWCPKYRRKVLAPPFDARLKEVIAEVACEAEMTFHTMEVGPDRVHLFVETDPTLAVAQEGIRMVALRSYKYRLLRARHDRAEERHARAVRTRRRMIPPRPTRPVQG